MFNNEPGEPLEVGDSLSLDHMLNKITRIIDIEKLPAENAFFIPFYDAFLQLNFIRIMNHLFGGKKQE